MAVHFHCTTCGVLRWRSFCNLLSFRVGAVLHTINIVIVFLVPHIVFMFIEQIPIVGMTTISFACVILALKLVSYAHVNKWCRDFSTGDKRRHRSISFNSAVLAGDECGAQVLNHDACIDSSAPQTSRVVYPHNLNAADFLYFLAVPTLCYELNFPRSNRIRLWFVARRVFELIVGINVLFALFQQWIIPSVCNSLEPFSKMHLTHTLERLLKLAIPNHLLWIMMFYLMFHSLFNLLAELLRFGDRRFYCDWWNCQDTATFWRTWNVPVHRFAMRHLYLPLIRHKFSRFSAALAVFFLSAFLHEYLVGFPLRLLRVWAFIGMMMQIPLSYVTAWVRHHMSARLSNVIVWLSLIVGQPLAILMYYHDYIIVYRRDLLV